MYAVFGEGKGLGNGTRLIPLLAYRYTRGLMMKDNQPKFALCLCLWFCIIYNVDRGSAGELYNRSVVSGGS